MSQFHAKNIPQVFSDLQTRPQGLEAAQVQERLKRYGKNDLPRSKTIQSGLATFIHQWKSPLLLILLAAGLVSGALAEYVDMAVILVTALANALIGFVQEHKANTALRTLQNMVTYTALVQRSGVTQEISHEDIVPGDILHVQAGDKIQADGRIISFHEFSVDESSLTGESLSIAKSSQTLKGQVVLPDRINMVHRGTVAVSGRADVVVTATGISTELGRIASLVQDTDDQTTPLQLQLERLAYWLGIFVGVICLGVFIFGVGLRMDQYSLLELFKTAVALAVAAIPEGLAISLTIILAIGMRFMLKRQALVRRLIAAETLGSVSVICTDKTGTITEGTMRVTRIITSNQDLDIPELDLLSEGKHVTVPVDVLQAIKISVLCNDATISLSGDKGEEKIVGDTTEKALIELGRRFGLAKQPLDVAFPRQTEIPFTSERKFMATLHHIDQDSLLYIKGAPDVLLPRCAFVEHEGKIKKISREAKEWFVHHEQILAEQGLRVLLMAYRLMPSKQATYAESDVDQLVLVGLIGMSDPIRKEVKETITQAQAAGIRTVMITGDQYRTASWIGEQVGLPVGKKHILDGAELETLSDAELRQKVQHVTIFARVNPVHKIRIVQALQAMGHVVAMTGDGVNDAPALKAADIGVALGSGTDVAKETADVVLLDDAYHTIIAAVYQGRTMYQNIQKVIVYLLSFSLSEVLLILASLIGGMPLALVPAQILWINITQDSFPAMALAFDQADSDTNLEPPRPKKSPLITRRMITMMVGMMIVPNIILFSIYWWYVYSTGDIQLSRTIVFAGLSVGSLFFIYSLHNLRREIWRTKLFANRYLNGAVVIGFLMLLLGIYATPLQRILGTTSLGSTEWLVLMAFGITNIIVIECIKKATLYIHYS